jgi:dsRNA-specific ribonuclease
VGTGSGRSKKHAEQEAARTALEMLYSADEDEFED